MRSKLYNENPDWYDKYGRRKPGVKTKKIKIQTKSEDPAAEDRKNRASVVSEIIKLVETGLSVEEAVKSFINSEKAKEDEGLLSKFRYFKSDNLETIFANWYKGRTRERRAIEK